MTMTRIDPLEWLRKRLEGDSDLMREMLTAMSSMLMSAEANAICGGEYRERFDERANSRNGYRHRRWDTRVGTIDLAVPKLRQGSYFPEWLLEPRRRAEQALASVITEAYVLGVSTRRVEGLVQTLGLAGISKSQVSSMAQDLDVLVEEFRNRPLNQASHRYVWLDALVEKCREGGRIANVAVLVATGVTEQGQRTVLGLDVVTTEDGSGWLSFLRSLVARGLHGVGLVISDAHQGLRDAVAATLPGASWQRCRTHFMRNLLCKVPRTAQDLVATLVRTIFSQPDAKTTQEQLERVIDQLQARFPEAANLLEKASHDLLAFTAFPKEHWKQIWSNNPLERLNKEIRRRTDVVGIFPNRAAIVRLVGSVLAEIHDEWSVSRRYMSLEGLSKIANNISPQVLPTTKLRARKAA